MIFSVAMKLNHIDHLKYVWRKRKHLNLFNVMFENLKKYCNYDFWKWKNTFILCWCRSFSWRLPELALQVSPITAVRNVAISPTSKAGQRAKTNVSTRNPLNTNDAQWNQRTPQHRILGLVAFPSAAITILPKNKWWPLKTAATFTKTLSGAWMNMLELNW